MPRPLLAALLALAATSAAAQSPGRSSAPASARPAARATTTAVQSPRRGATTAAVQPPGHITAITDAIARTAGTDSIAITGRVTAGTGQLQATVFDISVQDATGGIRIFSRKFGVEVHEGDSVVATGVVQRFRGTHELMATALTIVPTEARHIQPADVPIDQSLLPKYDGMLVRAKGRVARYGTSEGGQFLSLRDMNPEAKGTLTIWVPFNHGAPINLSRVRFEDSVTVVGVIARYQDNPSDPVVWQVEPRTRDDISVPAEPRDMPTWVTASALVIAFLLALALLAGRWTAGRQLRALRETEVRYHQLLALSPDAVLVHADGHIRFANPAAAKLLGLESEAQLSGRMLHDFVPPDFRGTIERPNLPEPGQLALRHRGNLKSSTGRLVDVEVTAAPCVYLDRPAVVVLARDITQQLRYERDLQGLALVDELTGLANRRGFSLFAEQELARARRERRVPVVVFADIDLLKQINDAHGHAAGDQAIRLVANAFRSVLRESDIVARWGGDEFVALIGEGGERAAQQVAARLAGAIAALRPATLAFVVHASVGMCPLDTSLSLAEALAAADAALYEQKKR